jgi:hypothetical protein
VAGAVGPKILGKATDLIFAGFFGANMPAGSDQGAGHRRDARRRAGPDG